MKKLRLMSGLVLLMLVAITPVAQAAELSPDTQPTAVVVKIDGQPADLRVPTLVINSATYVSVRDFTSAMGVGSVTLDDGTVTVTAPNLTLTTTVGNTYLVANDRCLFMPDGCLMENGEVMVPIRVMAKAFGATVDWLSDTGTISITKGSGAIIPGSEFYNETDLYWMSRIINAEAGGESFTGQIAVGSVVMNRLSSPEFPKSVQNVIFDDQYGVQFTPTSNGSIYNTPSESCIVAAKIALDGGNTAGDALYFAATTHCWAANNRPYAATIGNHYFFA